MAKQQRFRIVVSGVGQFPIDMLRYDGAHPASEDDSGRIERSFRPASKDDVDGRVSVRLSSGQQPTPARWSSFGWRVDLIEVL